MYYTNTIQILYPPTCLYVYIYVELNLNGKYSRWIEVMSGKAEETVKKQGSVIQQQQNLCSFNKLWNGKSKKSVERIEGNSLPDSYNNERIPLIVPMQMYHYCTNQWLTSPM